jgi:hypothetical protein
MFGSFSRTLGRRCSRVKPALNGADSVMKSSGSGQVVRVKKMQRSVSSMSECYTIALCLALAGIIADPTKSHAQSRSARTPATSENAMTPDAHPAQNEVTNPTYDNDPNKEKTTPSRANAADSWGPVPTKKLPVLIWHPTSCHTSTTDPCSGCREPTREIFAIALN